VVNLEKNGVSWILQLLIKVNIDDLVNVLGFQVKGQTGGLLLYCHSHKEIKVTNYLKKISTYRC
jgi:hypothetical protein